jgi:hypothetical protein
MKNAGLMAVLWSGICLVAVQQMRGNLDSPHDSPQLRGAALAARSEGALSVGASMRSNAGGL